MKENKIYLTTAIFKMYLLFRQYRQRKTKIFRQYTEEIYKQTCYNKMEVWQ